MDDLMTRMNAGIGPPCTHDTDRHPGDFPQRRLQCILHRATTGLTLPAVECGTAVFDTQRNSHNKAAPINPSPDIATNTVSRRIQGARLSCSDVRPPGTDG